MVLTYEKKLWKVFPDPSFKEVFTNFSGIDFTVDDNKQCITVRKKGMNKNNVDFNIPFEPEKLYTPQSIYNELTEYYKLYSNKYYYIATQDICTYLFSQLQQKHPDLFFFIKVRFKSSYSFLKKAITKSTLPQDVVAFRVIVSDKLGWKPSSKDKKEAENEHEAMLTQLCFQLEKEIKEILQKLTCVASKEKDYITTPKENGYQSIHLTFKSLKFCDFFFEVQIRTQSMEKSSKTDERISHASAYKPRLLNECSLNLLPMYTIVAKINGKMEIIHISMSDSFFNYYNITYSNYIEQLRFLWPYIKYIENVIW